jgi:hypothetical protein
MLADMCNAVVVKLQGGALVKVSPYEGQLEALEDFIINPPEAFVELTRGVKADDRVDTPIIYLSIYILTSNMIGTAHTSMYDLMDEIYALLHDKGLQDLDDNYLGHLFYESFDRMGVVPGFNVYQLSYRIEV